MGWLKIDRKIRDNWIWEDPVKLKWWIDILLTVNFEDKKVPIGFKIFECKRGESLMSLVNWANRWNVSKSVVNNYFKMLEADEMITIKNETVTTRLTVCNYDSYQIIENANETQQKRKKNAAETQCDTTKEREEYEERKEIILMSEIKISDGTDFNLKTAYFFWELFCKNISQLGVSQPSLLKTKWETWTDDIRLMMTSDRRTKEEIRKVYEFLRDEEITDGFCWKRNILSTDKLRKQFEKLLIQANSKKQSKQTNIYKTTD